MKKFLLAALFILLMAFIIPQKRKITIFMAGDSTMSIKERKAFPETGWGMPFVHFWDTTVTVANRAKNGRSTKTFLSEGLWKSIYDEIQEGDYVIIQFGHNDEAIDKKERYAAPDTFKMNLKKFISDTKLKRGVPILFTPVSRRKFDTQGNAQATHIVYSALVKDVAKSEGVLFYDLDSASQNLYQQFGAENSKLLFLQLKSGEHPNYPDGKEDNTHFNELGARLIAQMVLKGLREMCPELNQRVAAIQVKK